MLRRNFLAAAGTLIAATAASTATASAATVQGNGTTMTAGLNRLHMTALTQFVEADGIRFAYRRFGNKNGGVPLVFLMHFLGNMDNWDPAITDGIARDREVIIFDNTGIAGTSGEVPVTIDEMARDATSFITALGLTRVDLLGFSMGGLIAQQIALDHPELVRRLVLAGTGPRSGEGMTTQTPESRAVFGKKYAHPDDLWLGVFFTPSEASQKAGQAFLKRMEARQKNRDVDVDEKKVAPAQLAAIATWGASKPDPYAYLKQIKQPVLVVNGDNDIIILTINSFILKKNLPNAELIVYPDANHGSLFQYSDSFVKSVTSFLKDRDA